MAFLDVLSIACLISIIDLSCLHQEGFYGEDGISPDIVLCNRTSRRLARHFVWWWDSHYCFVNQADGSKGGQLGHLVENMILNHAHAFMEEVTYSSMLGIIPFTKECTPSRVREGLARHFRTPILIKPMDTRWEALMASGAPAEGYRYSGSRNFQVIEQESPGYCPSLSEFHSMDTKFLISLLYLFLGEVLAVTMNDICPSCTWEPSTEDDEMLDDEYNRLYTALAVVQEVNI